MNKLSLGAVIVGISAYLGAQAPLHIVNVNLQTDNCELPSRQNGYDITVAGGEAPYTLSSTNTDLVPQTSNDGNFQELNQIDPNEPVTITVTDAAGAKITQTYDPKASLFSVTTVVTACPGILSYAIILRGVGTDVSATLQGPGVLKTLTGKSNTFSNLRPGNYTLTLTPTGNVTAACSANLVMPVTIADLPFKLEAVNTRISQGGAEGVIQAQVIDGVPPYNFSVTGPVDQEVGPQGDPKVTFENLPGGFYTVFVSDSNVSVTGGCNAEQKLVVNVFENPVANRLALGSCS